MLALIAGEGTLPAVLSAGQKTPPFVCSLDGFVPDGVTPDLMFRLETLGTLLTTLTQQGITQVCFAGAIRRQPVDPSRIDAATMPLVPIIQQALAAGDNGALTAVIKIFESAGFTIVGAHEIQPDLLPSAGVLTKAEPAHQDQKDASRGGDVVSALSAADVGQSCVVLAGQVLALEGVFGTDWMLQSLQHRPDETDGGVLIKIPKVGQDRRVDLPTIGANTVTMAAAAGLTGLVIDAGGVMVLDLPAVIAACDDCGLFLWVQERDG